MLGRDRGLALAIAALASVPFVAVGLIQMSEPPLTGVSNDTFAIVADLCLLELGGVAPPLLWRFSHRPAGTGLLAGCLVVPSILLYTLGFLVEEAESGPLRVMDLAGAALLWMLSIGLGSLAGAWATLARRQRMPRWGPWACLLGVGAAFVGLLGASSEGADTLLPGMQLIWLVVGLAALGTVGLSARRLEPRRPEPEAAAVLD